MVETAIYMFETNRNYITIAFKSRTVRSKHSRKQNCNLFTAKGHCKTGNCPVEYTITVPKEPKNKESPCVFTVVVFGEKDHDLQNGVASRHLTGSDRVAMGKTSKS